MNNTSGLKPLGRAVLVAPYEPELKKGLIEIPDTVLDRTRMVEQRALVVEAGPEAWRDETVPRAQPGDKVMVSRYAGVLVTGPADGKPYRVVNANDIFLKIEGEQQ